MFHSRKKLLCGGDSGVRGEGGGANNSLKATSCLGLVKCYKVFHFEWNFWKFNYFPAFQYFYSTCVTLHQVYSTASPVLFTIITKNSLETMEWEKRRVFAYMAASVYHVISKEVENYSFRHNRIFRHKCMYKQPILRK